MDQRVIRKKLQLLQGLSVLSSRPITAWQCRTADFAVVGEYQYDGEWTAVELPAQFPAGKTIFLRANPVVPASAPLADTYLAFACHELEGLLRVAGGAYAGLDWWHHRVPAPRHGELELEIEYLSVPSSYHHSGPVTQTGCFSSASILVVSREIEALYYTVRFAWETAQAISDPRRKVLLEQAVEAALLAVDLTLAGSRLLEEVAYAQTIIDQQLATIKPDPEAGSLYAVGHSHIDVAWLWPLRETVRKCGRTFSTACRLMERFPSFHFNCSQPQLYQYTKTYFPEVYRQIKHWVQMGRWETSGAMWVEADCNVTSGEALIRQMLYGIAFFQHEFGTRPRICWLPDVFGYPSSLPEILLGCGIDAFYTYKLHWQARNKFPNHLFRWRGLDGAEVTAHVVDHVGAYNNNLCPEHLVKGWNLYAQKAEYPEVLFPYGFGDGGGGVTEEQLEMFRHAEGQFPGLPAVRTGTAEQFFQDIAPAASTLPVWDGELYVETHRGTYTTQSSMKRANRRCELLLREAEIWGTLASVTGAARDFSAATLRDAWLRLLLHQFHDILPGSSIGMVYREAMPALEDVQAQAARLVDASLAALLPMIDTEMRTIAVFNALSWSRQDIITVELPESAALTCVVAPDGRVLPTQMLERGEGTVTLLFPAHGIPPLGCAVFGLSPAAAPPTTGLTVNEQLLENRFFRIELNDDGGIVRLFDKRHDREVLATGAVGNDLQLLQDGPEEEDAWNIHDTLDLRRYPVEGATTIVIRESGPVRGAVRVTRTHRQTTLVQDIIIYADLPRIDFVTEVDWQERQTLLKVAFPLAIRSTRATYEVQFGAYERPTTRNTSWDQQKFEVPAQRWADLSEAGYGVSLLNDSRYGYDAKENILRLTLLRGTTFPDPEADRGRHAFTYALFPHAGGWSDAETVNRAWELNVPARAFLTCAQPAHLQSFLMLDGVPVIVEALKPAEDGRGFILRLYEPHGGRGTVTIHLLFPVQNVTACNLVEEDGAEISVCDQTFHFSLTPFQIRSFRIVVPE